MSFQGFDGIGFDSEEVVLVVLHQIVFSVIAEPGRCILYGHFGFCVIGYVGRDSITPFLEACHCTLMIHQSMSLINGFKQKMEDAVYTVDEIEQLTGMDFFPALDDKTEDRIEAKASLSEW